MDSKSIPRKGVGVRLPSLAPPAEDERVAAAREVGAVLVPALCRRLRTTTRALARVDGRLARDARRTLADERMARRQEELSAGLHRAGYCLGVLGAGARADLLRVRRERCGLRWMAAEIAAALALELEPGAGSLPEVELAGERGWNLVLLAGWSLCIAAARAGPALRWRLERDELLIAFPGAPPPAELVRRCRRLSSAGGFALRPRAGALGLALS